jgi:hypothetical protein
MTSTHIANKRATQQKQANQDKHKYNKTNTTKHKGKPGQTHIQQTSKTGNTRNKSTHIATNNGNKAQQAKP